MYKGLQGSHDSADKRTPHKSARLSFVEKNTKTKRWIGAPRAWGHHFGGAPVTFWAPPRDPEINLFQWFIKI